MMIIFYYDATFEGLLCSLFDAYKRKEFPDRLIQLGDIPPLLVSSYHTVETTRTKAIRVWRVLKNKLSRSAIRCVLMVWVAQPADCENLLFRYFCKVVDSSLPIETDFADEDVLTLRQVAKKIQRERHHILMFVRFTAAVDGIYFSAIAPRYNILPLVRSHFYDRFASQKWVLYDESRRYGYFYDGAKIMEITLEKDSNFLRQGHVNPRYRNEKESHYVTLWQAYFRAISIKDRRNPSLQKRNMPVRYWKYLPEMQVKIPRSKA